MKSKKKGFTLIEVVVVLVVIAIIAAIAIPSLISWFDKAEKKSEIVDCQKVVTAAQGLLGENYLAADETHTFDYSEAVKKAEVTGSILAAEVDSDATLQHLTYVDSKYTVYYCRKGGCDSCQKSEEFTLVEGTKKTEQQMADDSFRALGENFNQAVEDGFAGSKIDGVNCNTPGTWAYKMYNSLPEDIKNYLKGKSWSIAKTNYGWRIYFTPTNYGTETATDVKVYKYDIGTGQYQYTTTGKVSNGEVTTIGQKWSDWSNTID